MRDLDRRSILSALAGTAVGVGLLDRTSFTGRDRTEVRSVRPMMGTLVTAAAVTTSPDRAASGIDAAFAEMERLIGVFSRHDADAQVARLNASGTLTDPSPELVSVLRTARRVHDRTEGAFDPTVLPVLADTLRGDTSGGSADAVPGFDEVRIRDGAVHTAVPITLDGIAKGYIVDRGCATLRRWVDEAMIEAGGDIRAFGGSEGRWHIGIHDPRGDGYLSRIRLRNGAVATSGSYEVSHGERTSGADPVIRPATARRPEEDTCASVVSSTAERADALSTAAFVMDDSAAMSILERVDAGGMFLTTSGELIRTDSWREIPG
ncbi:FAD:protein FMN transferase [Haloplanus aerogenes]|nr:FAD:protein FMN transferase [Haloplanus aerogenes]